MFQARPQSVALFGGTFDPIHLGHTRPLSELADQFGWSHVHLQPCFAPPHRPAPAVNDTHRMRMVELACEDDPRLVADDFELRQQQPTRTVHTLAHLQRQHPQASLCFIMGMDSFINFTQWLNWQGILELAHVIVLPRPGYQLEQVPEELQQRLTQQDAPNLAQFSHGSGLIHLADTQHQAISATQLRQQLAARNIDTPCPELLAPKVYTYIQRHGLYQAKV